MKQNSTYKILLFLLIIVGTWSCERDDICSDTTATTPHLIIRFYDLVDPQLLKAVDGLSIRGIDANGVELPDLPIIQPFDSIALPLSFQNESTSARFSIEKNTNFRLDTLPDTNSNVDIIKVNYTPKSVYVSRACGYKSIFTDVSISIEQDGDNWLLTNEILTTTIDNENQAHIILRH